MAIKRHKPEEIVAKLRQVEVLVGQGMARIDAIRRISITEQTYYRWRKHYGGMGTDQLKGHCQTKANRYPKVVMHPPSGRKLAPLGQGSGAVLLEDVAAVEVAVLIEMVMDRGVDGGEFLQGFNVPKLRHRLLW